MGELFFLKLKRGLWFAACFMIILLFCSLPMKHFFENYVIAIVALILSVVIVPIYAYFKRRKNGQYMRIYFTVRYAENTTPTEKLKLSPLLIHFKVEAIVAAIYSLFLVAGAFYYVGKGMGIGLILLLCTVFTVLCVAVIMILDYFVWIKAFKFWEDQKAKQKANKKLGA